MRFARHPNLRYGLPAPRRGTTVIYGGGSQTQHGIPDFPYPFGFACEAVDLLRFPFTLRLETTASSGRFHMTAA